MIPGLGRSPGGGKGYLLQYSGLENSMGGIDYGIAKSQTGLSDFHFHSFVRFILLTNSECVQCTRHCSRPGEQSLVKTSVFSSSSFLW